MFVTQVKPVKCFNQEVGDKGIVGKTHGRRALSRRELTWEGSYKYDVNSKDL